MMKSADYYSGKASADDGKQISLLPNPSSIPAHQSISNQQRLIDDDKDRDKDNCIVVENGPPLPPPALPSVSPSSSSSSSMNTGSKAPIIISNSSGIFTTLTNRGRAPRTKRRKFIPKHPLNKRPVDFPIPALECDITEERQSKKLKTVHPSSTSVEINLPPTPSSQPRNSILVPCQKDEETIRNCSHCRAVVTPQWRAGPMGPKTLCNACGVRYKSGRLFPEYRPSASPTFEESRHSNNHKKVVELRGMNANVAKDVKTPASTKGCELLNYINDGCRK
ncbi:hypothetical protein ZOSMA_115G00120 [Zostera marina]|uniref:GATA-type domain-containing protein n=1 Tax=Zostera marina TaxID=29655 RepID=A0A0K9Q256_ZOSMR|nr:hypothetical protein ZOSMA_115G00120 [Zostera marina]